MIDLKASNEKLKNRAINIVSQISEASMSDSLSMLLKSNWEIKTAIVALRLHTDVNSARLELRKHGGVLRKVLKVTAGV